MPSLKRPALTLLDPNALNTTEPSTSTRPLKRQKTDHTPDPEPALPPTRPEPEPTNFIDSHFIAWVDALPESMVGPLGGDGTQLKMPVTSEDGRSLTWKKLAERLTGKIINLPRTDNDCWFIAAGLGDTSGYATVKIAAAGNRNKWTVHRIMYFLMHPEEIEEARGAKHCSHRCNRGRADTLKGIDVCCINPHHLRLCDGAENQDHKGCKRSQAAWCPHEPKCIFTNDEGFWLPCRNTTSRSTLCVCEMDCLGDRASEDAAGVASGEEE